MCGYQRDGGRERRPAKKFGSSFGGDRSSGRFGRDSEGSGRGFGSRPERGFGGRSGGFGRTESHEVVCEKCGKDTTVPFKPTGNKPVFCRDCFNQRSDSFSSPRAEPRYEPRAEPRARPDHSAENFEKINKDIEKINDKLEKILRALGVE